MFSLWLYKELQKRQKYWCTGKYFSHETCGQNWPANYDNTVRSILPGFGGVSVLLETQLLLAGVDGLWPFAFVWTLGTPTLTALPRLFTGVGPKVWLFLGVAVVLPLVLGVTKISDFLLDGVCDSLTDCPVDIVLLFLTALGVVKDFDLLTLLGVWHLSSCWFEVKLLFERPGVLTRDFGVGGAFLLLVPGWGSALTGCGLPWGLVNLVFGTPLVPLTGFKQAFVAGTLRGQTLGRAEISVGGPLETVNVSFKSATALEVEDDDVELVRRRRGCTPNPGGLIPLCEGTGN